MSLKNEIDTYGALLDAERMRLVDSACTQTFPERFTNIWKRKSPPPQKKKKKNVNVLKIYPFRINACPSMCPESKLWQTDYKNLEHFFSNLEHFFLTFTHVCICYGLGIFLSKRLSILLTLFACSLLHSVHWSHLTALLIFYRLKTPATPRTPGTPGLGRMVRARSDYALTQTKGCSGGGSMQYSGAAAYMVWNITANQGDIGVTSHETLTVTICDSGAVSATFW